MQTALPLCIPMSCSDEVTVAMNCYEKAPEVNNSDVPTQSTEASIFDLSSNPLSFFVPPLNNEDLFEQEETGSARAASIAAVAP